MSSATVTPSLVTFGEPQPLSSTALRPRGPSVLRTARASFDTPASKGSLASSSKTMFFATSEFLLVQIWFHTVARRLLRRLLNATEVNEPVVLLCGVLG
jgi:hypothetical protein